MKSESRFTPVASSVIGRVEVLEPRTASDSTMSWISLEDLLLDGHGFEDGLDDEVDSGEVLNRGARGDPVEDGLALLCRRLALGQC